MQTFVRAIDNYSRASPQQHFDNCDDILALEWCDRTITSESDFAVDISDNHFVPTVTWWHWKGRPTTNPVALFANLRQSDVSFPKSSLVRSMPGGLTAVS